MQLKQLETNIVYHGDCLDVMKSIPDKSIDLILTDPPYNVGIKYESYNDRLTLEEYISFSKSWFAECKRISKLILFTPGVINLSIWYNIENPYWIYIWYKNNQNSPSKLGGFNIYEPFLIYGKPYKKIGQDGFNMPIALQKECNEHPVPKYLKAWKYILNIFSNENDIILDCFAGSGTTGIACLELNRRYILIEKEKKYYDLINERIDNYNKQLKLFSGALCN